MSSKNLLVAVFVCLLTLWLSGCSTVWTVASGVRKPYSGTSIDAYIINSADATAAETCYAIVDFPFSLVGDAVVVVFMRPNGIEELISPNFQ